MTTEYDTKTVSRDRARAYRQIASLIADGMPAPKRASFSDDEAYADQLLIDLSTVADFDVWAARFHASVWSRNERHGGNIQCHASGVVWNGWMLYLSACIPAVRAVATAALTPDSPELPADEVDIPIWETCRMWTDNLDFRCALRIGHDGDHRVTAGASSYSWSGGRPLVSEETIAEAERLSQVTAVDTISAERVEGHGLFSIPDRSPDVDGERLDEICDDLNNTKRYMQRIVAKDMNDFVAVIANDDNGNPTEMAFGIDTRIYFANGFWSAVKP